MKKLIFILSLLFIFIGFKINVYAQTYTDKFYISDVIEGIFYAKEKDGKVEYRRAKFKRRKDDNEIVYCIEPFVGMSEEDTYKGYDYNYEKLLNIDYEDWNRIRLLAYYGYGYENHKDEKWYPITQLLIWETIDKEAKFFYTKTFKGEQTTKFTDEINELNNLVEEHKKLPSFSNKTINMSINSTLILEDKNNILNKYELKEKNSNIRIENNNLIINSSDIKENVEINLIRKDSYYKNLPVIYVSDVNQNVLTIGSYESINTKVNIDIDCGSIKIVKTDFETKNNIPQGEAKLEGTTFELYDVDDNYIDKITINESGEGYLNNIKYGNYRLIESISGTGYKLDKTEYYFNITKENKEILLNISNEVIKSKIKITKYTTNNNLKELESNITFQIFNSKNELYKEITTDNNGEAIFELPYGSYTVKQVNTTEGYYKVDDFIIKIDENSNEEINYYLNDVKIPDTNSKSYTKILLLLLSCLTLITFVLSYEKRNI